MGNVWGNRRRIFARIADCDCLSRDSSVRECSIGYDSYTLTECAFGNQSAELVATSWLYTDTEETKVEDGTNDGFA